MPAAYAVGMEIEQLRSDETNRLRAIRLQSLQTSPEVFGTTYEDTLTWPSDSWQQQLGRLTTFVAVEQGADVGIVRCVAHEERADTAWLISMWVAPEARGQGVGGALVDVVVEWARAEGFQRVLLDVIDDNEAAIALYARKGFVPTGGTSTFPPPREHVTEHERELRLV